MIEKSINTGRVWVNTGIKCPVCGSLIYRECVEVTLSPYDNFQCKGMGCKFTQHPMNQYSLMLWDMKNSKMRCRSRVQIISCSIKNRSYSNVTVGSVHIELPPPEKFKVVDKRSVWIRGYNFEPVKLKAGEFKRVSGKWDRPPLEDKTSECYGCPAGMCNVCKNEQYYYLISNGS